MSPASFDGLRAFYFDAYRPEKWGSNVYTRERLEVKQRLLSLARVLEPTFEKLGITLQRYASDEYPSLRNSKKVDAQWVFFWRTEEERQVLERQVNLEQTLASTLADPTPMTRHAFLCLRLDEAGLEMAFRLHRGAWVDQRNLMNKLTDAGHLEELTALVASIPAPESALLATSDGTTLTPENCTGEALLAMVKEHGEGAAGDGFLRFGIQLDRERTAELGAELPSFLESSLETIAGFYKQVSWSDGNDFVSDDEAFLESREKRGALRQEMAAHVAERQVAQQAKKREQQAARQELEELFRREAEAPRPRPPRAPNRPQERPQEAARPTSENDHREPRKKPPKKKAPPRPEPREPQPVQAGHEARVTKGPLAGQVGLVQEVDPRGTARIMVGLLATRIPVEDLLGLGPPLDGQPPK